jgi:hypothetical protein
MGAQPGADGQLEVLLFGGLADLPGQHEAPSGCPRRVDGQVRGLLLVEPADDLLFFSISTDLLLPRACRQPSRRRQVRVAGSASVRSFSDFHRSGRAGSATPTRLASSWAAKAMPKNSAIPVKFAHSRSAITPVSGP